MPPKDTLTFSLRVHKIINGRIHGSLISNLTILCPPAVFMGIAAILSKIIPDRVGGTGRGIKDHYSSILVYPGGLNLNL